MKHKITTWLNDVEYETLKRRAALSIRTPSEYTAYLICMGLGFCSEMYPEVKSRMTQPVEKTEVESENKAL